MGLRPLVEQLSVPKTPGYRDGRHFFLIAFVQVALLALTNAYWTEAEAFSIQVDTVAYAAIAECRFTGDCGNLSTSFLGHHLYRWIPNMLVGVISHETAMSLHKTYQLSCLVLIATIVVLVHLMKVRLVNKVTFLALVLFNPYMTRTFLAVPELIDHALFYLSIVAIVVGLVNRSSGFLLSALTLAPLARQTALLLIPATLYAVWENREHLRRLQVHSISLFLYAPLTVIAGYTLTSYGSSLLFHGNSNSLVDHLAGIRDWLIGGASSAEFLVRALTYTATLIPLCLLKIDGKGFRLALIAASSLAIQPVVAGPLITGPGVQRLLSFATPFLGLAFVNRAQGPLRAFFAMVSIFLISLHHKFSFIYDLGWSAGHYVIYVAVISAFILVLRWALFKNGV